MDNVVLLVVTMEGAEHCARMISEQAGAAVEVASSRKAALTALRQKAYSVVVIEESLAESDPLWADRVWEQAGLALPLQVNFAISGSARVAREVKAALGRRVEELAVARRAVAVQIENELKSSVTGLMLESELALREPSIPPALEPKLRHLVELAGTLRERLRHAAHDADPAVEGTRAA